MHPFPRICPWSTSFQSDVSIMTSIVSTSTFPDAGITSSSRSLVRVIWWIKMPTTNTNRSDTIPSIKGRVLTWKTPRLRCIIPRVNWLTSWPQILILLLTSFLLLLQCSSSSYSLCNRFVMSEKSSLSEIKTEAPENVAILWIGFVCLRLDLYEGGTKKIVSYFHIPSSSCLSLIIKLVLSMSRVSEYLSPPSIASVSDVTPLTKLEVWMLGQQ